MKTACAGADLMELRLDGVASPDLRRLLEHRPCPVIVTVRHGSQGGRYSGSEANRLAVLQNAIDLGAEYVDVELFAAGELEPRGNTKLIVSHHDFEKTPADLRVLHQELRKTGAHIVKLVTMARDICDNLRMFELLRSTDVPTIGFCMGEEGQISRVLTKKFGGYLTYAAPERGREAAPGQLTVSELRELYHYESIGTDTEIYGVIGNPVAHSLSPAIHNAAFQEAGIDAVYLPFKVADVGAFVRGFRALDVRGYSVTIPHKSRIVQELDEIGPLSRRIGAVNTVINRDGKLLGRNTDYMGALRPLERLLGGNGAHSLEGKRVVLCGAGGAARAVAFGLAERNAKVVIVNRTHEKGVKLAEEVGCGAQPRESLCDLAYDVLINTTSVGMHPNVDETPVPKEALRRGAVVMDAVYNPPETRLLREAREAGCRTISGVEWFIDQAAAQFELWTGMKAPHELMTDVLLMRLGAGN